MRPSSFTAPHLLWALLAAPATAGLASPSHEIQGRRTSAPKTVEYTFNAKDWIVNYLRPTVDLGGKAKRQNPWNMPADVRKAAQLVNGMYPGPLIEANENDTIVVHVVNDLLGEGLTIHWHGIRSSPHVPSAPRVRPSHTLVQG